MSIHLSWFRPLSLQYTKVQNSTLSLGRFGTLPANLILGRPYYYTYEISENEAERDLRVVPATELHAEEITSTVDSADSEGRANEDEDGVEFDIIGENGEVLMRSNRLTIDDPSRQRLTMEEIEELKKAGTGSGKEIIAKIMASHQAIEEKTTFALAKYTLRKTRKYLKRFTILPLDVSALAQVLTDKEAFRVMELRDESIGLIMSWANAHHCGLDHRHSERNEKGSEKSGRYIVVDDTGGLVVAALAERMGILFPYEFDDDVGAAMSKDDSLLDDDEKREVDVVSNELGGPTSFDETSNIGTVPLADMLEIGSNDDANDAPGSTKCSQPKVENTPVRHAIPAMSASTNTITVVHSAPQPNLSLLKYFNFDASFTQPTPTSYPAVSRGLLWPSIAPHPLFTHLKCLSWLQLLDPDSDSSYQEPEYANPETVREWKSGRRGAYYRKRRRWERSKFVIDETRRGGFDGLIVASTMEPATILKHTVPLLRGGAQVVIYSPQVEPLSQLADLYSKERKSAFLERFPERVSDLAKEKDCLENSVPVEEVLRQRLEQDDKDFPLDPTILLGSTVQTSRARKWQVLPGRTHPFMTSRGGSEGYIFSATRVLPVEDRKVSARGKFGKKRKLDANGEEVRADSMQDSIDVSENGKDPEILNSSSS